MAFTGSASTLFFPPSCWEGVWGNSFLPSSSVVFFTLLPSGSSPHHVPSPLPADQALPSSGEGGTIQLPFVADQVLSKTRRKGTGLFIFQTGNDCREKPRKECSLSLARSHRHTHCHSAKPLSWHGALEKNKPRTEAGLTKSPGNQGRKRIMRQDKREIG